MQEKSLQVSAEIDIYFRDNEASGKPALLMLHSLSDNGFAFDGIISAGLGSHFRIITPDLRGRGKSGRPATGYSLDDHSQDLIALLDSLGIKKVFLSGHSFGGLLALYFASHFRDRVLGLALIDAAAELNPLTPAFMTLMTDRLGKWYPSKESYLLKMRAAPFMRFWDENMERCFLADTEILTDDTLIVRTQKWHIAQCAVAVQAVSKKEWRTWAQRIQGPSLVLWAAEPFIGGEFIVPERKALETAVLLPEGESHTVPGNHLTMLFGEGAMSIATRIMERFTRSGTGRAFSRKAAGIAFAG
jgi:pimeloyl-ACP methyl ester carboxylesterase